MILASSSVHSFWFSFFFSFNAYHYLYQRCFGLQTATIMNERKTKKKLHNENIIEIEAQAEEERARVKKREKKEMKNTETSFCI